MKHLFTILACVLLGFAAQAQWQPLGSPANGSAKNIWSSGNNLYVLTGSGNTFYRSTDAGNSWTKILEFTSDWGFTSSNNIILGGDSILINFNGKYYRSADAGSTWDITTAPYDYNYYKVRGRILAITDSLNSQIDNNLKTNDWGLTWEPYNQASFFSASVIYGYNMAVANNRLFYISNSGSLYIDVDSTDYSLVNSILPHALRLSGYGSTLIYNGIYPNLHYVSKDNGLNWDTINDPHIQNSPYHLNFYSNNDTLFFIYNDSIYYQTTDPAVWFPVNGLPTGKTLTDMVKYQGLYYVTSLEGGVYKSADLNGPWDHIPDFALNSTAKVIEVLNNTYYISNDAGNLVTTSDNFATFQPLNYFIDGAPHTEAFDFFNMDGTLFGVFNDTVVKSSDGGANWNKITTIGVGLPVIDHFKLIHEGNTLFLSVYYPYQNSNNHYFLTSTDFGNTWTIIYGDLLTYNEWADGFFIKNGNAFFLISGWNNSAVRKYNITNNGVYFENTLAYQLTPITWVKKANNVLLGANYQYTGNPDFLYQMYVSYDNGLTWMYGGADLPAQYINGWFSGNGSQLVAWVPDHGVYYSNNQGLNWAAINNNVDGARIVSMNNLNNELYIYSRFDKFWKRTFPGGDVECAAGKVYFDENNNNVFDPADHPSADKRVSSNTNYNYVFSNLQGKYNLCVQDFVNDTIKASYYDPNVFFSPSNYVVNMADTNYNFKIQFQNQSNDVKVELTPMSFPVSGFSNCYFLTLSNIGSTPASGTVSLSFNNTLVLNSTSETPASTTSSTLVWNFSNLYPTSQKTYWANFIFPGNEFPLATPVQFVASVQPTFVDNVPTNNIDSLNQLVVSSYDPNDKTVNLPRYLTPAQVAQKPELTYTVRFQNTGNWPAQTVFVIDTLSDNLDLSTFHVITASHNYEIEFLGNRIVKFNFPDINLADSTSNEPASHGLIKYAIRCISNIPINDSIVNTAHIFFDFNVPVATKSAINIVANPDRIAEQEMGFNADIVPNPASGMVTVRMEEENDYQVQITTVDGRMITTTKMVGTSGVMDISSLSKGIYLVRITSGTKSIVRKLIVE